MVAYLVTFRLHSPGACFYIGLCCFCIVFCCFCIGLCYVCAKERFICKDYNEFPQSLAPSVLKDANVDGHDLILDAATKKLLSSFTKVNFDWQALGSIDSGSCVEVGVDISELLRRHGTSSQAALQRLATYLMDPNSVPSLDQVRFQQKNQLISYCRILICYQES